MQEKRHKAIKRVEGQGTKELLMQMILELRHGTKLEFNQTPIFTQEQIGRLLSTSPANVGRQLQKYYKEKNIESLINKQMVARFESRKRGRVDAKYNKWT